MTAAAFIPVERLWPESTVVCLATGPSLSKTDVDYCRGRARVIAVNDAVTLAPWSDALYFADEKWSRWHREMIVGFAGLKFTIEPKSKGWSLAHVLRNAGPNGIERQPNGLKTGMNSGYQAINLSVHLGARRILLLGYDMAGDHFFGSHRDKTKPPFAGCIAAMRTIVAPLHALGIEIVNCSRRTAIDAFPTISLEEALP